MLHCSGEFQRTRQVARDPPLPCQQDNRPEVIRLQPKGFLVGVQGASRVETGDEVTDAAPLGGAFRSGGAGLVLQAHDGAVDVAFVRCKFLHSGTGIGIGVGDEIPDRPVAALALAGIGGLTRLLPVELGLDAVQLCLFLG